MQRIVIKDGKDKTFYFIIFMEVFDFSDWHYIKLAHECLHICQFFLPTVSQREQEHECEAYLHTHLMQQALNALRK